MNSISKYALAGLGLVLGAAAIVSFVIWKLIELIGGLYG